MTLFCLLTAAASLTGWSQPNPDKGSGWKTMGNDDSTNPPFLHRILDGDGGHTQIGDINNDGRNDVVIHQAQQLAWLEYPGFQRHVIRQGAFSGDRFALADMDGDGDLDVVTGKGREETNFQICWYGNPGSDTGAGAASEWEEHVIGAQGGYNKDLMVADMNRDGVLDVVARCRAFTQIHLQGRNGEWRARKIAHPQAEGMALADLDKDGDIDIILNGFWFETPPDLEHGEFVQHTIAERWFNQSAGGWQDNCASVGVGDIDRDGLIDVLFSHSEKIGWPIAWYRVASPEKVKTGPWEEHIIAPQVDWCETLQVGDVDRDGSLDVMAAEFERPANKNPMLTNAPPFPVVVFLNVKGDGTEWSPRRITDTGAYAAMLGDVGSDGDLDIVGPHTYFKGPVELWENPAANREPASPRPIRGGGVRPVRLPLDRWHYIQVDDARTKRFFGLAMGDVTGDGFQDIAAGQWFYRNPGGEMTAKWDRVTLPEGMDSIAIVDVNGNDRGDIIALKSNAQFWLEAGDRQGTSWEVHQIGSLPLDDHRLGSQEYAVAQIVPGGKPELIIAAGGSTWHLQIPENPEHGPWPAVCVTDGGQGCGIGDFDGDGLLDIAGSVRGEGIGDPLPGSRGARLNNSQVCWWKNPRTGAGQWQRFDAGLATSADRYAVGDLNGDRRPDIVITEERFPGSVPNANLQWFENPGDPRHGPWTRRVIVTQLSMNNLDVADMDGDGDLDIVTCEHKMPPSRGETVPNNERLQIWENDGRGNFTCRTVDTGKESHLGARVADLDADGDLDIVSIAWRNFQFLHVWRNEAVKAPPTTAGQRMDASGRSSP